MKTNKKWILPFAGILCLFLASCTNELSLNSEKESSSAEYGTIVINSKDNAASRLLDTSLLKTATVIVSGYGMDDVVVENVAISGGKGSASVSAILSGKNRVVTVKSNLDGAVIRGLVDVHANSENACTVTWSTTARAGIFYNLIKNGVDVSGFDVAEFDGAIPDVHASLVDVASIAKDYKSLKSASNYILDYGTVELTTTGVSGYTVQITDIASEKVSITSASQSATLKAYPGNWKVWVLKDGSVVSTKDVAVVASETSKVTVSVGSVDFSDKTIAFVKSTSAPKLWAWEQDGVELTKTLGGEWDKSSSATLMTAATKEYMSDPSGWFMMDFTSVASSPAKTIKFKLNFGGNELTGAAGTFWYNGSSSTTNPSPVTGGVVIDVENPKLPVTPIKIYVSSTSSAPTLWALTSKINNITTAAAYPGVTMTAATDLNDNSNWYVAQMDSAKIDTSNTEKINFIINGDGKDINSTKTTTFWYDAAGVVGTANKYYDSDPTSVPEPVKPTVTIKPANGGTVAANGMIVVTLTNGNDTIKSASVNISGATTKSYSYSDFGGGVLTINVADLKVSVGSTLTVNATVTNSVGTASAKSELTVKEEQKDDPFTWDNVNAYFVLTDRFYNGDTTNDNAYGRQRASGDEDVATFHGGDIAGLTQKIDYFADLGVNAIWITAPYEQAHGWVGGKDNKFPHYAFHGYYTLDWTAMDQAMGTVEELRTFVNACHSKGIRVIMDIVMNHVGYNNVADMKTYDHGYTPHEATWFAKTNGKWDANDGVNWDNSLWDSKWWGPWIRSFGYASGIEYGGSCGGLPDVKSELTSSVGLAPVLKTKWNKDSSTVKSKYYNPSVAKADWNGYSGDYRTDKGIAPADYQVVWLSAWVRELGIDGFRCDTAKHVEPWRWGQLKVACTAALEAWRKDSSKSKLYNGVDTGAADWDESFWMTGECWGWTSISDGGDYYSTGKFDSMINFSFNGGNNWDGNYRTNYPKADAWSSYLSINNNGDSDGNGHRDNVLTYISSHDTGLTRVGDQYEVGTGLVLLPGGVQIYYGDESYREKAYTGCGDGDMYTRGDMNWNNTDLVAHWGKVGKFRKYNPAVGAGTGSAYKRSYSGSAGESKVAIGISGTSVDVSGLWSDGTTVYNWYDGKSASVNGGKATFSSGTGSMKTPILVSDKNPADYE